MLDTSSKVLQSLIEMNVFSCEVLNDLTLKKHAHKVYTEMACHLYACENDVSIHLIVQTSIHSLSRYIGKASHLCEFEGALLSVNFWCMFWYSLDESKCVRLLFYVRLLLHYLEPLMI